MSKQTNPPPDSTPIGLRFTQEEWALIRKALNRLMPDTPAEWDKSVGLEKTIIKALKLRE